MIEIDSAEVFNFGLKYCVVSKTKEGLLLPETFCKTIEEAFQYCIIHNDKKLTIINSTQVKMMDGYELNQCEDY